MIQLYLALGLLGFIYVNNKNKEKEKINTLRNKQIKTNNTIEGFDSKPKQISVQDKEIKDLDEQRKVNNFNKTKLITKGIPEESFINKQFSKGLTQKSRTISEEKFLTDSRGIDPIFSENDTDIVPNSEDNIKRQNRVFQSLSGMDEFNYKKVESRPFFKPVKNLTHINGAPNINEYEKDRMNKTNMRKSELPFEQIKVGPGLGEEYGNKPVGGFHQVEVQDIIKPKTIDQLRAKNNQKVSYKGLVIKGKSINNKRKNMGRIEKRRPDTFYENNEDRYFKTTGSVLKDKNRLNFNVDEKTTNRTTSRSFVGIAKTDNNNHKVNPNVKETTRNNYKTTGVRNLHSKQTWESVEKISDYGRHTFIAYANERDVTQQRTYKSNFNTVVKALISPLLDKFKKTKKENVEGNIRPEGNLGMSVPQKQTVYDPNDIARTTIKETTIHNKHEGHIKVGEKTKIYKYDTLPKITIRNTLNLVDTNMNMGTKISKPKQFSNQPVKATIKQTTIEQKHLGQPHVKKNDGYKIVNAKAPNTNRQFTSNHKYSGIACSKNKQPTSYDASYNASLNINKERIAKGREPTLSGPKKNISGKDIIIVHKKQMAETKTQKPREGIKFIKPQTDVRLTTFKDHSYIDNTDRINPDILSPLEQNPYFIKNAGNYDYPMSNEGNTLSPKYTNIEEDEDISIETRIQEEIDKL
jgi:hypothetical protein